jgi:NADH-quinone oxidoreductase subunit G
MADLLLPAASSSEQQGCWLNSQGKLQLSLACMPANEQRRPSWQWVAQRTKDSYEQLLHWCSEQFPLLSKIVDCQSQQNCVFTLARQSFRASGRTAINARIDVKEYPPPQDILSGYQFSMEGVAPFRQHHCDLKTTSGAYLWQPKWNSNQGANKGCQQNFGVSGCAIFPPPNSSKTYDSYADAATAKPKPLSPDQLSPAQEMAADSLNLLPLTCFYDANELSHYCPALATLMTPTIFKTSVHTAAQLNWNDGDSYQLTLNHNQIIGQCHISKKCPSQCVLISELAYRTLGLSPGNCHFSLSQLRGTSNDI